MSGVEEVRPEALIAVHRLEAAEADPSVEQYVDAVLEVVADRAVAAADPAGAGRGAAGGGGQHAAEAPRAAV